MTSGEEEGAGDQERETAIDGTLRSRRTRTRVSTTSATVSATAATTTTTRPRRNNDDARQILKTLHPLVDRMLVVLRRLQPPAASATATHEGLLSHAQEHQLLQLLLELLTAYGTALQNISCVPTSRSTEHNTGTTTSTPTSTSTTANDADLATSLLAYALQPCLVALQTVGATRRRRSDDNDADDNGDKQPGVLVRDSLRRQVWKQAVSLLLFLRGGGGDSSCKNTTVVVVAAWKEAWSTAQRVSLVHSLVATLPVPPPISTPSFDASLQETLQRLYYTTLQAVVQPVTVREEHATTTMATALRKLGGGEAVVARLVETCLLAPHGAASITLASSSFTCLQAILRSLPHETALWQRLFPGTFYALYKRVVVPRQQKQQRPQQQASRPSRQSTATGLATLVTLLQAVVAVVPVTTIVPHRPSSTATTTTTTIQAWQSTFPNTRKDCPPATTVTESEHTNATPETLFWTRVAQNLAMPLQRLVIQCRRTDNSLLALKLARLLLESWWPLLEACLVDDKDRAPWQALQQTLMDVCVSLTQQHQEGGDPGGMATQAQTFLTQHSNDRWLAGLQDRWESLWEDWLADTMSQRWTDWEDHVELLTGYVRLLRRRDVQAFLMSKEDGLAVRLWSTIWTVNWPTLTAQWWDGSLATSTNVLPWKYLDTNRQTRLESFLSALAKQLGPRSSAVLVDDYIGHVRRQMNPSMEFTSQSIGLLQVTHGFVVSTQGTTAKHKQSLEMLTQFTLPVVLTLLSRIDRPALTEPLQVKGFAACNASLLRLVTSFFNACTNSERLRSVCLFPVLSMYACPNWAVAKYTALATLEGMADFQHGDERSRLESLVVSSIDTILSTSLTRLRIDLNSPELTETIQTTAMALRIACPLFESNDDETRVDVVLALAREVLSVAMARFDLWTRHAKDALNATLVFVDFFDAAIVFLTASVKACPSKLSTSRVPVVGEEWLCLLDDFRTKKIGKGITDENCSPPVNGARAASKYETDLIAKVVSIGSYLLSHQSLRVQTMVCTLLGNCFSLLLEISLLPQSTTEEVNGAQNAILRHIADCWPALSARAKATLQVLRAPKPSTSIVIATHTGDPASRRMVDMGPSRLFLSQLFNLVAAMVEASGDFMSSRLRESTWPWVDQVLAGAATRKRSGFGDQGTSSVLLLESVLDCVTRIFRHRATAVPLAGLIPSVGRRLVVLLDSDEGVANRAACTMECLVQVDRDALLRPLSMVGGVSLPGSPFRPQSSNHSGLLPSTVPTAHTQQLARALLQFIDDQPEQSLEYI